MTDTQHDRDAVNGGSRREADQRLGAFVTNKWLVGVLLILVISMGGYIFKGYDRSTEVHASQIDVLQKRTSDNEIEFATTRTTIALQYQEIIRQFSEANRRLERIENGRTK